MKDYLEEFEVITLVETFVEEKNYAKLENALPHQFNWTWMSAIRCKKKGRASGGILMGVRTTHICNTQWQDQSNWSIGKSVTIGGVALDIIGVYNRTGVGGMKVNLAKRLDESKGRRCLMMGDWNARAGTLSGVDISDGGSRQSMDTMLDKEGEDMIELMEEFGFGVLNGRTKGDWTGQITHVDYRSKSVIDYAACNELLNNYISEMKVGDKTQSDHFPIEIELNIGSQQTNHVEEAKWIPNYSPRAMLLYKKAMEEKDITSETPWEQLHQHMRDAIPKRKVRKRELTNKDWWTAECYSCRREMVDKLRAAKRNPEMYAQYFTAKRRYKTEIRKSKKAKQDQEMEKLRDITDINNAWQYLKHNRGDTITRKPDDDKLFKHFYNLLDGEMVQPETALIAPVDLDDGHLIAADELEGHILGLKTGKAEGPDGLKAEALKHADAKSKEAMRTIFNKCLKGLNFPVGWRKARIHPILKKGDPTVPANYRGIAIGDSMYKLYASILGARLEKYVEDNNLLPDSQNGFRKLRSAVDNIYILNHIIAKAVSKKKRVFCAFIDFKAAFDTVDRPLLFKRLEKLGIPQYIIVAIKNIYAGTTSEIGGRMFHQTKGLRQGCPLSPLLFALYIGDLEDVLNKQQSGGVVIGRRVKLYCLAYADDLVIIACTPNELRDMLNTLKRYADRRKLTVNTTKSKVMRFSVGGKLSKEKWLYDGINMEEVRSFNYLGFVFQINGKYGSQIAHRTGAARRAVAQTWSLAERKFPENYPVRKQMFDSLVLPTMTYGCEVTGFAERDTIEAQARKYFRWTLGLRQGTRNAILMDETKTQQIHILTGARAMKYEERAMRSPCEILRACVSEVQKGGANDHWAQERVSYFHRGGLSEAVVNSTLQSGGSVVEAIRWTQQCASEQVNLSKIDQLRYRIIRPHTLPPYLRHSRMYKLICRFRCENEEWGRERWRENRMCRICGREEETLEHQAAYCAQFVGSVRRLLDQRGRGADDMRRIIDLRVNRP